MKPLTKRKRRALERGPVSAACLTCQWSATGPTWRPVRRQLAIHTARLHAEIAGSVLLTKEEN